MQMKTERAIEILDPEHREHYESLSVVQEACRMGMAALEKQRAKKVTVNTDETFGDSVFCCPNCFNVAICNPCNRSYNGGFFKYCPECGQHLERS